MCNKQKPCQTLQNPKLLAPQFCQCTAQLQMCYTCKLPQSNSQIQFTQPLQNTCLPGGPQQFNCLPGFPIQNNCIPLCQPTPYRPLFMSNAYNGIVYFTIDKDDDNYTIKEVDFNTPANTNIFTINPANVAYTENTQIYIITLVNAQYTNSNYYNIKPSCNDDNLYTITRVNMGQCLPMDTGMRQKNILRYVTPLSSNPACQSVTPFGPCLI